MDTCYPLDQFVLKVHSRCDLACDRCYVYEAADQSWRGRPKAISDEILSWAAQRIAKPAPRRDLRSEQIVLRGGEPLLLDVAGLRRAIAGLHSAPRDVCELNLRINTNEVRLNQEFYELFAEYGVRVGILIDGDRSANDRHRRYADGRNSYGQIARAIELLRTGHFRSLYAGLLCTIDIVNDPVVVYEALTALQYADWLIAIFDRWLAGERPRPQSSSARQLARTTRTVTATFVCTGPVQPCKCQDEGFTERSRKERPWLAS